MRLEFLEPEELDKISGEEWHYIIDYVCEDCSGIHDWTEEAARNLRLYGSIFDFYEEEFGHSVVPGER